MVETGGWVPDVRKIAVVRANSLGDFVFALPALDALRSAYPDAEIVLLGLDWHARFLAGRPGPVDRVVVVPPYGGVSVWEGTPEDPAEQERFFASMAAERFDLAVQIHGGGLHSNPFTRRLGARLTAGLKTPNAVALDRWVPYVYSQKEVARYLEAVALVGAPPRGLEPRIAVTPADLAEANRLVPDTGLPLVALHPGAVDSERRWPPEKFASVGDALAAAGARVVVTGTASEGKLVRAVIETMRGEALDLCGRTTLSGLAGLLSRCAVVVANDTGPLHLAAAVGAATVGIYWGYNLLNAGPLTRARHRPCIGWRVDCPTCHANRVLQACADRSSLIADVAVERVVAAALELLTAAGDGSQGNHALVA